VRERLLKQGAVWGLAVAEDAEIDASEFSVFVLTPEGISFSFAPYEVHCYAAGSFFATIPWGEIAGIVDAERWPVLKRWTSSSERRGAKVSAR
jgi:hypothetical protein